MTGYPLAALLALRERTEVSARLDLAQALAEEERERAERDAAAARAERHRARHAREAAALVAGPALGSAGGLAARVAFAERLRREAAVLGEASGRAEVGLARAEGETEARRAALADARRALRALERHREGWRAAGKRRHERREDSAADDLVSARRAGP